MNQEGSPRCLSFPGHADLAKLPDGVRDLFQIKIVEHSDVYYASFIDKLFERLGEAGVGEVDDHSSCAAPSEPFTPVVNAALAPNGGDIAAAGDDAAATSPRGAFGRGLASPTGGP